MTTDHVILPHIEYAIELECRGLPSNRQTYDCRKLVAEEVLRSVAEGKTSLQDLFAAARRAVVEILGGEPVESDLMQALAG